MFCINLYSMPKFKAHFQRKRGGGWEGGKGGGWGEERKRETEGDGERERMKEELRD